MEASTSFKIFYDANDKELANHAIDAKILGLSITSMAELIETADELLNEGQQTVKVLVTNPAEEGSLGIAFTIVELLPYAISAAKVIGLTGLAAAGLGGSALSLIRQLGSKKVIAITKKTGTNTSILEVEGEEIECSNEVAKLVTDPTVRQALINVVRAPLSGKDDPVFKIIDENGETVLKLEGDETEEIKPLPRGTLLEKEVETKDVNVKFIQVNFDGDKGWRIEYNNDQHSVALDDEEFLVKVRAGTITFSKEDLFVVSLETTKTFTARGVTNRYAVKKVKRQRPA